MNNARLARSNDASERLAARAQRTAGEQLALLDSRPGAASKERRRLLAEIARDVNKKVIDGS